MESIVLGKRLNQENLKLLQDFYENIFCLYQFQLQNQSVIQVWKLPRLFKFNTNSTWNQDFYHIADVSFFFYLKKQEGPKMKGVGWKSTRVLHQILNQKIITEIHVYFM